MFNIGNGIWIAPQFVTSVTLTKPEEEGFISSVTIKAGNDFWQVTMEDLEFGFAGLPQQGLHALGYKSLEEFCEALADAARGRWRDPVGVI